MAIWFYPLFLVISTALKTQSEAVTSPLALPSEPSLDAFWSAWTTLDMGTQLRNTLIIAVGTLDRSRVCL